NGNFVPLQISNDDPVVRAVGNEEPVAGFVGQYLSGKEERTIAALLKASEFIARCLFLQRFLLSMRFYESCYHIVERLAQPSAAALADQICFGVNHPKGGPRIDAIGTPDFHLSVVNNRVTDFVAQNGLTDTLRIPLVFEFRRVDSDHRQMIG